MTESFAFDNQVYLLLVLQVLLKDLSLVINCFLLHKTVDSDTVIAFLTVRPSVTSWYVVIVTEPLIHSSSNQCHMVG